MPVQITKVPFSPITHCRILHNIACKVGEISLAPTAWVFHLKIRPRFLWKFSRNDEMVVL